MTNLKGANTTAQWYGNRYTGGWQGTIEKFLIHTTETSGWPGYSGGASAPNATYHAREREIRQHFPIERSARALRDPSSTEVRENRDGVFQLEIICFSDYSLARRWGGLWVGDLTEANMRDIAAMCRQLHDDFGLRLDSSVRWREGQRTYVSGVRLSGPQYDAYKGILGHVHASGNTHWDPGGFRYSELDQALQGQGEEEEVVTQQDKIDIANMAAGATVGKMVRNKTLARQIGRWVWDFPHSEEKGAISHLNNLLLRTGNRVRAVIDIPIKRGGSGIETRVRTSDGGRYSYRGVVQAQETNAKLDAVIEMLAELQEKDAAQVQREVQQRAVDASASMEVIDSEEAAKEEPEEFPAADTSLMEGMEEVEEEEVKAG